MDPGAPRKRKRSWNQRGPFSSPHVKDDVAALHLVSESTQEQRQIVRPQRSFRAVHVVSASRNLASGSHSHAKERERTVITLVSASGVRPENSRKNKKKKKGKKQRSALADSRNVASVEGFLPNPPLPSYTEEEISFLALAEEDIMSERGRYGAERSAKYRALDSGAFGQDEQIAGLSREAGLARGASSVLPRAESIMMREEERVGVERYPKEQAFGYGGFGDVTNDARKHGFPYEPAVYGEGGTLPWDLKPENIGAGRSSRGRSSYDTLFGDARYDEAVFHGASSTLPWTEKGKRISSGPSPIARPLYDTGFEDIRSDVQIPGFRHEQAFYGTGSALLLEENNGKLGRIGSRPSYNAGIGDAKHDPRIRDFPQEPLFDGAVHTLHWTEKDLKPERMETGRSSIQGPLLYDGGFSTGVYVPCAERNHFDFLETESKNRVYSHSEYIPDDQSVRKQNIFGDRDHVSQLAQRHWASQKAPENFESAWVEKDITAGKGYFGSGRSPRGRRLHDGDSVNLRRINTGYDFQEIEPQRTVYSYSGNIVDRNMLQDLDLAEKRASFYTGNFVDPSMSNQVLPHEFDLAERRVYSRRADITDRSLGKNLALLEEDRVLQFRPESATITQWKTSPKNAKTKRMEVVAWGKKILATVTKEASVVERWIQAQRGGMFGLDLEWRPNFAKGQNNKVALLQLCGENDCLIVQMLFLDRIPKLLVEFLLDSSKTFAGVGIQFDTKKLHDDYGLVCRKVVDITTFAAERLNQGELKRSGLKTLLQQVLGLEMKKPKRVTTSNWAKRELDDIQLEYACMDAWASFAIYQKLMSGQI